MENRGSAGTRQRVQIKLCGLRLEEDIRIVNEVMPEYAGFILAEGRKRTVTPERMAELSKGLDGRIQRVAVFLDQDPEWICHLAGQDLMDIIQLHGSESDEMIRMIQKRTGKKVIKALRMEGAERAGKAPRMEGAERAGKALRMEGAERAGKAPRVEGSDKADTVQGDLSGRKASMQAASRVQDCAADLVLLDHGNGGSGERFDWSLTGGISRPFILAGGLTPENVCEAIGRTHPMAVDVSSGVETDSVKDVTKVRLFVKNVRNSVNSGRIRWN